MYLVWGSRLQRLNVMMLCPMSEEWWKYEPCKITKAHALHVDLTLHELVGLRFGYSCKWATCVSIIAS